jgi:5'-nucleotidase
MAESIAKRSKSDVGLYHFGGVRIDSLRKDGISIGDVFTLEPFSSTIYTAQMTTDEIRQMIINKFNDSVNPKESHRPDINPYGTSYTILTDAEGEAVDVQFSTLKEGRTYKVAMGDYMYKNYNFPKNGAHEATGILVTDVILDELRHHSPLKYTNEERISIVEQ